MRITKRIILVFTAACILVLGCGVLAPSGELPEQIIDDANHEMMLIPAGSFQMGSESGGWSAQPVHTVELDAFFMDVFEVTNAHFATFLNEEGNQIDCGVFTSLPECKSTWLNSGNPESKVVEQDELFHVVAGYEEHPVVGVTWYGAAAYCDWRGARLPTEAEWEYSARGGLEGFDFPWGDEPPTCTPGSVNGAQFDRCDEHTVPVGSFTANGYGLHDMAGNVQEWVADWADLEYYAVSPTENPKGPAIGSGKVVRGGSGDTNVLFLQVAFRGANFLPFIPLPDTGFRCARSP